MPDEPENLPAVPSGATLEGLVFDGEVVDDTPAAAVPAAAVTVSPRVQRAARHALLVAAGAVVMARRWHRRRNLSADMAAIARARGDHANAHLWALQAEAERQARHDRRVETAATVVMLAKAAPWLLGAALASAFVLGCLLSAKWGLHGFLWPWEFLVGIAVTVADIASFLWLLVPVALLGAVVTLHELGRHAGELAPKWAAVSADPDADVSIDEAAITAALKALRIPQITDYLKGGSPLAYIVPCRQEGRGTYAEIRLPMGLPASEIAKQARRERLAAGLYRHTKEVWPSTGADNSHLKLWIADKGALADGAGPYPLLDDGVTDVFKGVPFGRTLRGDEVTAPLMERNTITGGMPGQGKSSAARAVMCGAALDPTAELWIMIPDVNFDFEVMKRRCSRYVMGAEDEHVETIRDWLRDLKDEVLARGQILVDYEVPSVTRKLASAQIGLHPLFVLLEEAHVAIQHGKYGKEISQLLIDIVRLGRKRGIHVIVSTQAPTKDSMPRDVTRNCSNGIAFAVGDHVANDALLGQGAYRGGHRATELIPGTDLGVAVVKGFSGERSEMVQVYFLDVGKVTDQVTPIIDRAMAEVAKRGGLPGSAAPVLAIEARDLLSDLDEVLGDERVKLRDAVGLLRGLARSWYQDKTATQLRADLEDEGARTVNHHGTHYLDPAEVRRARAGRDGVM